MVYQDDLGGAKHVDRAVAAFDHFGWVLEHCGLDEAPDKLFPLQQT